jgi:hypothetical protein
MLLSISPHCGLLPERVILKIHPPMQDFKWQSFKDNFHNPIFDIDKMLPFGIFDSTILLCFLFPRGWWMEKGL